MGPLYCTKTSVTYYQHTPREVKMLEDPNFTGAEACKSACFAEISNSRYECMSLHVYAFSSSNHRGYHTHLLLVYKRFCTLPAQAVNSVYSGFE